MSEDTLRDSLEELFSGFRPPEPEGMPGPSTPPQKEGRTEPAPPPAAEEGPTISTPPPEAQAGPGISPGLSQSHSPITAPPQLVVAEDLGEGGEELEPPRRTLISARVTGVRDRLVGTFLILLSLLAAAALLIFTSFNQMEKATTAVQQELMRENVALEVGRTTIELLAVLKEEGAERDEARFKQVVGEALQALKEAQDRLADVILLLPPGDPLRSELVRLRDYSLPAAELASSMLRHVEEEDWERVEFYTQSRFISFYHNRLVGVMGRVKELAEERREAQLALFAEARRTVRTVPVVWGLLIAATALITAVATVRSIASPLERLTQAADRLAAGYLDERVHIEQSDEFGRLATAFNRMAENLQTIYNELEERVQERTRALQEANYALQRRAMYLEASAEIGRAITSIFDRDRLLHQAVELIRERFGFYHAGIFLIDETGQWAVLQEATGEAGERMKAQGHRLRVEETSMVGWTALHRRPRIALDVGEDAVHFANPLLPHTRSEMTLPLMVGDRLLGVLDVQSTEEAAFDEDDVRALQSMADQIAIALENARRVSDEALLLEATSPIYRASRRLTTATSVKEVADAIVASVKETGADGFIFALVEPYGAEEPKMFRFISSWRRDQEPQIPSGTLLPASASHVRLQTIRTHWVARDISSSEGIFTEEEKAFLLQAGVKAAASIPLRTGDRLLGFVVVYSMTPGGFTKGALRLYEMLSDQASVALERMQLLEATRRRAEMEAAVRAIGDRMARAVDLESVVRSTTEELGRLLRASGVCAELGSGVTMTREWEHGG